jgi:hypothetical protein
VGGGLLDQVTGRAERHHLIDIGIVAVGGEYQDLRAGQEPEDLACGLEPIRVSLRRKSLTTSDLNPIKSE